jgi:predicted ATP-grasp superfamily ATP-dependent carboligase
LGSHNRPARVLIVGVSTRAAAESAARAGFDVIALDAYADLDQHRSVRALSLPRDFGKTFSAEAIAAVAPELSSDAVVYLSNLENHPKAVDVLARGRKLWGNDSGVLRRVRDPLVLAREFEVRGIRVPRVVTSQQSAEQHRDVRRWLIKPRISGGGHGVRVWSANEPVTRGHYLQEFIDGVPGSVVFVAAAGRGVAIGATRQLVGETAFGASGFRYCGNILDASISPDTSAATIALVDAVTDAFPLVGVGSIDFVVAGNELRPVEVNPRWSASMELVERARDISLFSLHAEACNRGALPEFERTEPPSTSATYGKAIVFAPRDVVIGDVSGWLDDQNIRDVPHTGEHITTGQPICTIFAAGSDDATCYAMLVERAEKIYSELNKA